MAKSTSTRWAVTGGRVAKSWTRTSVTGISNSPAILADSLAPRKANRAFTLIELLVVVMILGIVSAVVVMSLGLLGDDRELEQHARRVSSLIELAEDEALMQGRDFGLEFTRQGYRFVEHDPISGRWYELTGDDLLRPRRLDEGMEFLLELDDRQVALAEEAAEIAAEGDEDESRDREGDYLPHLLILSSGDVTPFELRLVRATDRAEVQVALSPAGILEIRTGE